MEFLQYYNNPKNFRFKSFEFALIEAKKRNLKTFVETGVARGKNKFLFFSKINWKDGLKTTLEWYKKFFMSKEKAFESSFKKPEL